MELLKFLINNWAQTSFILVAIGYIINVFLKYIFKKKEIRYNFFLNNRMKALEKFLSDYTNIEGTFNDTSTSYFYKSITTKEVDSIILPLRYNLTDSLAKLQLYTSQKEFKTFSEVYKNFNNLMDSVWQIRKKSIEEIEKLNALSSVLSRYSLINNDLLKEIIRQIQKDIK